LWSCDLFHSSHLIPHLEATLEKKARKSFAHNRLATWVLRRLYVPHIKHVAMLIDRSPEGVLLTLNRKNNLVQMPLVATTVMTAMQFIGIRLTK